MAEGRMLKKKISPNEAVADLSDDSHRLLFTWGIPHLDVEGRITGSPRGFKAMVAPLLEHITPEVVLAFFKDAESKGLIQNWPEAKLSRFVTGRRIPSKDDIEALAKALVLSPEELQQP
jgi:hypothetical protein